MGKQMCKFIYADRCVIDEHKGMPFSYQLFSCLSEFSLLTCVFVPSFQPLVNQTWKDWHVLFLPHLSLVWLTVVYCPLTPAPSHLPMFHPVSFRLPQQHSARGPSFS